MSRTLFEGHNDREIVAQALREMPSIRKEWSVDDTKMYDLSELNIYQRHIAMTYDCHVSVRTDGFYGYFSNTFGETAELAFEGFRSIGALAYAQLLRRAISVFPYREISVQDFQDGIPLIDAAKPIAEWGLLDISYYELMKSDSIFKYWANFVKENNNNF